MTTKVLDYKFLMGFFGPSSGELWATRDIMLPMKTALGPLCCGRAGRAGAEGRGWRAGTRRARASCPALT